MKTRRNLPEEDYDTTEDLEQEQEEEMEVVDDKPRGRGRPPKPTQRQAPQPKQEVAEWKFFANPPNIGIFNPTTKEVISAETSEQAEWIWRAKMFTMMEKIMNTI